MTDSRHFFSRHSRSLLHRTEKALFLSDNCPKADKYREHTVVVAINLMGMLQCFVLPKGSFDFNYVVLDSSAKLRLQDH